MTDTLFIGKQADSLHWSTDRQAEALAALKSLRIRPARLTDGYCRVSYEGYVKLRQAGMLTHKMSRE